MLKFITEAKKHSSSIVEVVVPVEIWNRVIQNVPGAKDLQDPPHITLCYMHNLNKDNLEQVKEALSKFCSQWAPVQVTITGSDSFNSDKAKVPHFAKIFAPQLVEIRDALIECLQDIDPDLVEMDEFPTFVPHLTIQYAAKEDKLPVVKPIPWVVRSLCLSFKGTDKTEYPLSLVTKMQDIETTEKEASVITVQNLKTLATNISSKLASLGYEAESLKIIEASEVLGNKKKKRKDTSVEKFQKKLHEQLKQYVPYHNMDKATHSIMNLLMDDMGHDAPGDHRDSFEESGDMGGESGGDGGDGGGGAEGDAVEALGPHMEGVDDHIMGPGSARMKGMRSIVDPTANKATPFMERNYSAELRTWLRRNT